MNKALFLDRDGVINKEVNYLYKIEDFEFLEGVIETCRYFQNAGYLLFVITNQAGIARGYYTEDDFHILNNWMLEQFKNSGSHITKVYYSPYHPVYGIGKYKQDTLCRKPKPGMILQAQQEFNLDLSASILVGDKESDIEAGIAAGVRTNILVRSGHSIDEEQTLANLIVDCLSNLKTWLFV
jgi:D-glycero-D-manno-heptose 1,7-bisphosphate phosphatase